MKRSAIPACVSSVSGDQAVAVTDIQLRLLSTLTAYNRKCSFAIKYSFAVNSTKLTLDVDILPWVENHHTTAGGRGSRRRRKRRRTRETDDDLDSEDLRDVYDKGKPIQKEKPIQKDKPILKDKPIQKDKPKDDADAYSKDTNDICVCGPLVCMCMKPKKLPKPPERTNTLRRSGNTKQSSEKPALLVQNTELKGSMISKVEEFLKKKDEQPLKQKPWFYGNITRQQCIDLMQDQAMNGEFMIRESESNRDDFVLSVKTGIKVSGLEIKHLKIVKKGEEGLKMDGYDQMFSDLDELVIYFMNHNTRCLRSRVAIFQPIKNKEKHQHLAETRNKRSQSVRQIYCLYCEQFHNKVHYCGIKRCFILWDYYLFLKMEGPTQDSVLRPAGYAVDEATHTNFYKNIYEMILLCNDDAKEWNKIWVKEEINERAFLLRREKVAIQLKYPCADLLDEKDTKGDDNTLEKERKKLDNLINDDYMKFDI